MPLSILHVGLPLDHPSIPAEDRPILTRRLAALQQSMRDAGYLYTIFQISPQNLEDFRNILRTQPCDGLLIGGGVVGNPDLTFFMEQIVDTTHQLAPNAKIIFHSHAVDVRTSVERWFPPPRT